MSEQEALEKIKQLSAEKEMLEAENQELTNRIRLLHTHRDEQKDNARRQYTQGLIDALVFAVRCNGVCGNDVELPERYGRYFK